MLVWRPSTRDVFLSHLPCLTEEKKSQTLYCFGQSLTQQNFDRVPKYINHFVQRVSKQVVQVERVTLPINYGEVCTNILYCLQGQ